MLTYIFLSKLYLINTFSTYKNGKLFRHTKLCI
uniref:Uncharacterized protein n=1 Tax=Anguilla anguilla TaxID=7936 RepID=A0A0E9RVB7_ANGAN